MAVKVLVFGQLTDITGSTTVSVEDAKDTDELTRKLHAKYPGLAAMKYVVAVEKQVISVNTALHQDNIVALLPPYAGG